MALFHNPYEPIARVSEYVSGASAQPTKIDLSLPGVDFVSKLSLPVLIGQNNVPV